MRGKIPPVLTLVLLFMLSGQFSGAQTQNLVKSGFGKKHRSQVGFKGGIINQTDFQAVSTSDSGDTARHRTRVGFSWQLFFDQPVSKSLLATLSFEMQDIHIVDERYQMLDIGLSLKLPIYKEVSGLAWRPLVGVGYAYLGQGENLEKSGYVTGRVGIEGIFFSDQRHAFLGEFIVYGSLSGGNDSHDIKFGPVVLLRLGVIY